jgi:hypothetical protein
MKEDWGGKLLPTTTKLNTWGELGNEGGRVRVRGDNEMDVKTIESSFTDHCTSPLDCMSTLPKIFNFDEGFSCRDGSTSNLTTGDKGERIEIWITFLQILVSPGWGDLPVITTRNTSPTMTEEELAVTNTLKSGNAEGEGGGADTKMREEHESW